MQDFDPERYANDTFDEETLEQIAALMHTSSWSVDMLAQQFDEKLSLADEGKSTQLSAKFH